MKDTLVLPIGFYTPDGTPVKQMPVAHISGDAEVILTRKPKRGMLYTWMGQVIAVAVAEINGQPISPNFLSTVGKQPSYVPEPILNIPLVDVGSLLIQVQRACWEETIPNQRVKCIHCGTVMQNVGLELSQISIPEGDPMPAKDFVIELGADISTTHPGIDSLEEFNGLKYNAIKVRVPTLRDGISAQGIVKAADSEEQQINFWREIMFNCIVEFLYIENGNQIALPSGYLNRRGKLIFTKDWGTKVNKHARKMIQTSLPTALFYYEDECTSCGEPTPFYATPGSFFTS
jgi:hypothetical protein